MLNVCIPDIRDKLDPHIKGIESVFPDNDVLGGLSKEQLQALIDEARQRLLDLIKAYDEYAKGVVARANEQQGRKIEADFDGKPKNSYSLYSGH